MGILIVVVVQCVFKNFAFFVFFYVILARMIQLG